MKTRILLLLGVSVLLAGVVNAQETPAPNQGGSDISGIFTIGYRLLDVSGATESDWDQNNANNLFREQFSLSKDGPSLGNVIPMSLNLFGRKAGVFDQFFINAEVNPTVQGGSLRLRDFGAYDLNVSYKNVNYYYDRYDSLYNDLRHHESTRQDLSATLDIHATENVGIELGYRAIGHGGFVQLPRPLYLETAPIEGPDRIYFNVYRNYFLQELPRTDLNKELHLGIKADFDMVSVSAGGGFTDFTEEFEMTPAQTRDALPLNFRTRDSLTGYRNEFGIVGDNTNAEHLTYFFHNEARELSGPFFFGSAVIKPADIFSLSANFRMEQLEGETTLDLGEQTEVRRTAGSGASMRRYNLFMRGSQTGEITSTLDRLMLSAVATIAPIPELDVNAGIKMTNHDLESIADYHIRLDTASIAANPTFASGLDSTGQPMHLAFVSTNKQPVMTVFGNVNVAPMQDLTLTAGVTMISRTPEVNRTHHGDADSVIANNMSKETSSLGFNVGVGYRIMPELRVRARFEMLQREATFSDQTFFAGPASGTVTDLEPRTAPEDVMRIGANLDWGVTDGLDVGLRFLMNNGKSDLNESMVITADLGNPVEYKNDDLTIAANVGYALDENTHIRLMGESRSQKLSMPITWTRGQKLIPIFGAEPGAPVYQNQVDSASVILAQETNDLFIDLGFDTKVAEKLTLGAGFSFLDVTGNPSITPQVGGSGSYASTPTRQGDVTRTGGPFSRITVNGKIGYDITQQFGILLDVLYAMQDEKEVDLELQGNAPAEVRFYGLNDYNGFSAALNAVYNF